MRPVVAQVLGLYLPRTQTFVYGMLRNLDRVQPAVFACELENLQLFPHADVTVVPLPGPGLAAIDKASRVLLGQHAIRSRRWERAVSSRQASVVHGHFGWSAPTTVPLRRSLGTPLVTTFYGADMSANARLERWRRIYEQLFVEGDLFLVEGGHMAEQLAMLGAPREKLRIQRIGVDVGSIEFRERRPAEGEDTRFLLCASFREKKGTRYAIEAFAEVAAEREHVRLTVAGDGPLRDELERLIDRLGVRDRVDMLGYVDHPGLMRLLAESHVFVAPSVVAADGDTEGGAPTVLLEAQAAGLPVLSTHHADIPEVVLDGVSGHLVPERDAHALAERMVWLLDHGDEWAAMGRAGRLHVERQHDLQPLARRLEDYYFELMN